MPRFAANLSLMYGEWPFEQRIDAAADDGFEAVECQFPYGLPAADLARRLDARGLQMVLINAPPGAAGERGLAALPGREDDFRRSLLEQALPYAQALRCPRVHVMAGTAAPGIDRSRMQDVFDANLAWAARQAASAGVTLLIEPLNARDMPGYFLRDQAQAHTTVARVGASHLAVQMDLYHLWLTEGDVEGQLRHRLAPGQTTRVGHLQVAGVPDRHEPDADAPYDSALDYGAIFRLIDDLGWDGWVGAEYRPRAGTRDGLGWWQPWRPAVER